MNCIAGIKVGSTTFYMVTPLDNALGVTLDSLVKLLKSDKEVVWWERKDNIKKSSAELREAIIEAVKDPKQYKLSARKNISTVLKNLFDDNIPPFIKDLAAQEQVNKLKKSLIGNATLEDLSKTFSVDFGNSKLLQNEQILYTSSSDYRNIGLGNGITMGDLTIYLIADKYDAVRLASYLKTREMVNNFDPDDFPPSGKAKFALDFIAKDDYKAAVLKFFNHSDLYLTATTKDNQGNLIDVYASVHRYIQEYVSKGYLRRLYNDYVIDSILERADYNSYKKNYIIHESLVADIMDAARSAIEDPDAEDIVDLLTKDGDKPKSSTDLVANLNKYFARHNILIRAKVYKNRIELKSLYNTFKDIGLALDLTKVPTPIEQQHGYYIYQFNDTYYVTTAKTLSVRTGANSQFSSLEDARAYVQNRLQQVTIQKGANIDLFRPEALNKNGVQEPINLSKYYPTSSTITIYKVDKARRNLYKHAGDSESDYYVDPTLSYFYYKGLNELCNALNGKGVDENKVYNLTYNGAILLLNKLKDKPLGEYSTEDLNKFLEDIEDSMHEFTVLHLNNNNQTVLYGNYDTPADTPPQPPMHYALSQLAEFINKKVGREKEEDYLIRVLSAEDVNKIFGPEFISVKGFVHNGLIIINSTLANWSDVYHELAHLLLGMIKGQDLAGYTELMQKLANTLPMIRRMAELQSIHLYQNLAAEDLAEEAFVSLLSESLERRGKLNDFWKDPQHIELLDMKGALAKVIDDYDGRRNFTKIYDEFSKLLNEFVQNYSGFLNFREGAEKVRKALEMLTKSLANGDILKQC